MSVPMQFAAKWVPIAVFTSVVYRKFDNPAARLVRAVFYSLMRFVAKWLPGVILASVVRRLDNLAASLVRAVFYPPMRFLAKRVSPVIFTSVVRRVDDLAARLVGAALHLRQAALAVRARTSEFVDFLDAVRAQADAAGLLRCASWAARASRRLPEGTALCAGWSPIRLWSSTTQRGVALRAGWSLFARQSDENQEGEEAEEEAEHEPRAAAVPFLISQVGTEEPDDHPGYEIHQQKRKDFHDDFPTSCASVGLPFYHSGASTAARGMWERKRNSVDKWLPINIR